MPSSCSVPHLVLLGIAVARLAGKVPDPSGIHRRVSEANLLHSVGLECDLTVYDAPYSDKTYSANLSAYSSPKYPYVLVGAKTSHRHNTYHIVALGPSDIALRRTYSSERAHHGGGGVYWYYYVGYSFGFAPSRVVSLNYADKESRNCSRRMSWHLDNDRGGWSAGCRTALWDSEMRKIVKLCRRPVAEGKDLMVYSNSHLTVIRLGTWRRPSSNDLDIAAPANLSNIPVNIGALVTLEDDGSMHQSLGMAVANAYLSTVWWVNEFNGGVFLGGQWRPFEMTLIDDRSDTVMVQRATQHLVEEVGTHMLVGPHVPLLSKEASEIASSNGAIMLTPTEASENVYKEQPGIFGLAPSVNDTFAILLAELGLRGAKSIGILQESIFQDNACAEVPALASQNEMNVNWSYTFDSNPSSGLTLLHLDNVFELLTDATPDIVLFCAYSSTSRAFYREIVSRQTDLSALVFTGCILTKDWLETFGEDGLFVTSVCPWVPGSASWISDRMRELFELGVSTPRSVPTYHPSVSYTSVAVLLEAIENAGTQDPTKVANALRSMTVETVIGLVHFGENRSNNVSWKVVQYHPDSAKVQQVLPLQEGGLSMAYPTPPWELRRCFVHPKSQVRLGSSEPSGLIDGVCGRCPGRFQAVWQPMAWNGISAMVCKAPICLPGHVLDNRNTSSGCHPCPAGTMSAQSNYKCIPCTPGTFSKAEGQEFCRDCSPGSFSAMNRQTACQLCNPGTAQIVQGSVYCNECPRGTFSDRPGSTVCSLCQAGTISEGRSSMTCMLCAPGRSSDWGGVSCSDCPVGKFQPNAGSSVCHKCPVGSLCPDMGQDTAMNLPNFWELKFIEDGSSYHIFLPCGVKDVCLAGQRCSEGHTGVLCNVCLPGYSQHRDADPCARCGNWAWAMVGGFLVALLVVMLLFFITNLAVGNATQPTAISDALLKLFINYLLSFSISAKFFSSIYQWRARKGGTSSVEIPPALTYILEFSFEELLRDFLPYECIFQPSIQPGEQHWFEMLQAANHTATFSAGMMEEARQELASFHWHVAMRQILFWLFAPILLISFLALVGLLDLLFKFARTKESITLLSTIQEQGIQTCLRDHDLKARLKGMSSKEIASLATLSDHKELGFYKLLDYAEHWQVSRVQFFKQFCIDSEPIVIVTLFLVYPNLVATLSAPLRCNSPLRTVEHIVGHQRFMVDQPDLECYKVDDPLFWLSLFGLLVYIVGVPSYFGWKMLFNQHNHAIHFKRTWGFMMNGYDQSTNYWEICVLLRKAMCVLVVSIAMDEGLRALLFLLLSLGYSILHLTFRPFDNRCNELLDTVEGRHLIIWWIFSLAIYWLVLDSQHPYSLEGIPHASSGQTLVYVVLISMLVLHMLFICMILRLIVIHVAESYATLLLDRTENHQRLADRVREELETPVSPAPKLSGKPSTRNIFTASLKTTLTGLPATLQSAARYTMSSEERLEYERRYFGSWAYRYQERFLAGQPHLACDNRRLWFALIGSNGHKLAKRPIKLRSFQDNTWGQLSKSATEYQRRFLISIIQDALHRIFLNCPMSLFSPSLLEFVLRGGFAFDEMRQPRDCVSKEGTAGGEAPTPSFLSLPSSSGSQGSRRSSSSLSLSEGPSSKRLYQRLTFLSAKSASQDDSPELTDKEMEVMVKQMLTKNVFKVGLPLQHLQVHLTFLNNVPDESLQKLLLMFESEWEKEVIRRLRQSNMLNAGQAKARSVPIDDSSDSSSSAPSWDVASLYPVAADESQPTAGLSDETSTDGDRVGLSEVVLQFASKQDVRNAFVQTKDSYFDELAIQVEASFQEHVARRWARIVADLLLQEDVKASKLSGLLALAKRARTEREKKEHVQERENLLARLRWEQASRFNAIMQREDRSVALIREGHETLSKELEQLKLLHEEVRQLRQLLGKPQAPALGATGFGLLESRTGLIMTTLLPPPPRDDDDVIDDEFEADTEEGQFEFGKAAKHVDSGDNREELEVALGLKKRSPRVCEMDCFDRA